MHLNLIQGLQSRLLRLDDTRLVQKESKNNEKRNKQTGTPETGVAHQPSAVKGPGWNQIDFS
jgi:hypothetical protein